LVTSQRGNVFAFLTNFNWLWALI